MRKQCAKCPWRVDVDPNDIPNGYDPKKHCALKSTISDGTYRGPAIRAMACHATPTGKELACVGWLVHQLGVGNNIALRMAVAFGHIDGKVETIGEQHQRFEDTLPESER